MTSMDDKTEEEFLSIMQSFPNLSERDFHRLDPFISSMIEEISKTPKFVSWHDDEAVVSSVDQGQCESCWALAVAGLLDGQQRKLNKK